MQFRNFLRGPFLKTVLQLGSANGKALQSVLEGPIGFHGRTSQGDPIQAFDNARRDLTVGFLAAGFSRADMVDYTLRPDVAPVTTDVAAVTGIAEATARATRGCLLYLTSHGGPQGLVFGPNRILSPTSMVTLVRGWCQDRPTVVVLSACYSGIFVEPSPRPTG